MSSWLEAYESLSEAQQINVQKWLHLNKFIARTLQIDEREWFEGYLQDAMAHPLDYSFMAATIPNFDAEDDGFDPEAGGAFIKGLDAEVPKVPLRAENNLGRLSPALQDAISAMFEGTRTEPHPLLPADVAQLQKILPGAKALAKLKRKDFRNVSIVRDFSTDDVLLFLKGGDEIARVNVMEFSAVLSRKLV